MPQKNHKYIIYLCSTPRDCAALFEDALCICFACPCPPLCAGAEFPLPCNDAGVAAFADVADVYVGTRDGTWEVCNGCVAAFADVADAYVADAYVADACVADAYVADAYVARSVGGHVWSAGSRVSLAGERVRGVFGSSVCICMYLCMVWYVSIFVCAHVWFKCVVSW